MLIRFNSIQPIFFGRFIQENDNFVVVSNSKKIIFKRIPKKKKRLLVNIFSLCDGTNTVKNIISKFSSLGYNSKEISDLLKYLIKQKILVDSREIFLRFHPYVENLTPFYHKLSKEKIKSLLREVDELKYNGKHIRLSRFPNSQFCKLIKRRRTIRDFDEQKTISLHTLSGLLYSAYGVSEKTKISGVKVLKRVVPSAGALYPLHLFCIILKKIENVYPGIYYLNKKNTTLRLTKIREISDHRVLKEFIVNHEEIIKRASVLLVIVCNFKKVSQKYSNRGYIYGLLETGHVAQNIYLYCTEQNLAVVEVGGFNDKILSDFLKLNYPQTAPIICFLIGVPKNKQ
jgi:SagB-type dehydrogenase family enzyme